MSAELFNLKVVPRYVFLNQRHVKSGYSKEVSFPKGEDVLLYVEVSRKIVNAARRSFSPEGARDL